MRYIRAEFAVCSEAACGHDNVLHHMVPKFSKPSTVGPKGLAVMVFDSFVPSSRLGTMDTHCRSPSSFIITQQGSLNDHCISQNVTRCNMKTRSRSTEMGEEKMPYKSTQAIQSNGTDEHFNSTENDNTASSAHGLLPCSSVWFFFDLSHGDARQLLHLSSPYISPFHTIIPSVDCSQ